LKKDREPRRPQGAEKKCELEKPPNRTKKIMRLAVSLDKKKKRPLTRCAR